MRFFQSWPSVRQVHRSPTNEIGATPRWNGCCTELWYTWTEAAPFFHSCLSSVEHSGEIARPTVIRGPAVSATLEEWQAEYAPGAKDQH
jgi:hypothetical protein